MTARQYWSEDWLGTPVHIAAGCGRLTDADAVGRVDDAETDTMVEIYVKLDAGVIVRAKFRTFGCSASKFGNGCW